METKLLFCDDLVTQENSKTALMRDHVRGWYLASLKPKLEPNGRVITVGDCVPTDDFYEKLVDSYPHKVLCPGG